jgi:hypothetical protein
VPALSRVRTLPWLVLFELARTTKSHLDEHLTAADRREVADIFRRTKGDVRKLDARDKEALRRIARTVDLPTLVRTVGPAATRLRGGRRRRF